MHWSVYMKFYVTLYFEQHHLPSWCVTIDSNLSAYYIIPDVPVAGGNLLLLLGEICFLGKLHSLGSFSLEDFGKFSTAWLWEAFSRRKLPSRENLLLLCSGGYLLHGKALSPRKWKLALLGKISPGGKLAPLRSFFPEEAGSLRILAPSGSFH